MAMLSYSNFGSDKDGSAARVHKAVEILQNKYPEWSLDGEMQVNIALDRELRDKKYPFSRLNGKDVNTLIFPCLNTANTTYKMLQALTTDVEIIGPIQMGLNKPVHFIDFESTVEDIVNVTAIASIDAMVSKNVENE
jgi:malate dehydrogenase (oxaloacetate-decarboxylating)(NADP+)